jgi:hypothetical protein
MSASPEGNAQVRRSGWFSADGGDPRPLRLGYEAWLDGSAVVGRLARELPPHAADLIEIAAMTYAADRLARRKADRDAADGSGWGRQFQLQIPVRCPDLWADVAGELTELLGWLTHDDWALKFCQLDPGAGSLDQPQGFLFDLVPDGSPAALFSGGLDSALGLARDLDLDPVAVSIYTNPRMQATQRNVFYQICGGRSRCLHLQYRVALHQADCENNQRTRGLLFLAAGIGTAWGLGQDRLRVYENGIGAINLPYLRSQHGPQATRSTHPHTLWLAEQLASKISGRPFRIDAPFMLVTKAEAVRSVPNISTATIAATVSCDAGFAARVPGARQCGICTSCLLRRQALLAAGRFDADAATAYRTRNLGDSEGLMAMTWQLDRLARALADRVPWHGLVSEFPPVLDTNPLAPGEVVRLYRAYVREWEAVGPEFGLRRHDGAAAL